MFRAPTHAGLPHLHYMTGDIPASIEQMARHLGISPRTLQRYIKDEQAPRAIMLALFWETRWGRSAADAEAANAATQYAALAASLQRQNDRLRAQIAALEELLAANAESAANSPFFRVG